MLDFAPMIVVSVLFIITVWILKRPKHQRRASLVYLFALSGCLIVLGDRWTINMVPAHYMGYGLAVFGLFGLFGVNIWYGGPLDPRREQSESNTTDKDDDGDHSTPPAR